MHTNYVRLSLGIIFFSLGIYHILSFIFSIFTFAFLAIGLIFLFRCVEYGDPKQKRNVEIWNAECDNCGNVFEFFKNINGTTLVKCPNCGKEEIV